MLKTILRAAALSTMAFAIVPAFADTPVVATNCTEGMAQMKMMMQTMPAGDNKVGATKMVAMAQDRMDHKDEAGCMNQVSQFIKLYNGK